MNYHFRKLTKPQRKPKLRKSIVMAQRIRVLPRRNKSLRTVPILKLLFGLLCPPMSNHQRLLLLLWPKQDPRPQSSVVWIAPQPVNRLQKRRQQIAPLELRGVPLLTEKACLKVLGKANEGFAVNGAIG